MSEKPLSLPRLAALLVLMREAREISNTELKERYGLTLNGKDRLRLNDLKLVESWKEGRSFVHVLTDAGWAYAAETFQKGIERPAGSAGVAMLVLMEGLQGFMERTGHRLSDVFAPEAGRSDVEARIRAAYAEMTGEPGTWVSIPALRSRLGGIPRADVDDALRRMSRLRDVNIAPESNQKTLAPEDREAAVTIGDQDKHLLWIGER
ncbi:hypothetical protein [Sphaerisporangium sp. TRM90804]|uniref:hypothetical protein n=1 Tax=Sphaerisporangium sp. TRM90804 TaxID=3031113 RepID=UPI00244A2C08|nr:hypothetical protein [Sphaerisporangium sp. TRM90804]MDH2427258.1 hypothetical protein [Sphaerisporangium sp. TRM90804]